MVALAGIRDATSFPQLWNRSPVPVHSPHAHIAGLLLELIFQQAMKHVALLEIWSFIERDQMPSQARRSESCSSLLP